MTRKVHGVHYSYREFYWLKSISHIYIMIQSRAMSCDDNPETIPGPPRGWQPLGPRLVNTRKYSEIVENHPPQFVNNLYRSHAHRHRTHHYSRPPCWFMVYGVRQEPLLNLTLQLEL